MKTTLSMFIGAGLALGACSSADRISPGQKLELLETDGGASSTTVTVVGCPSAAGAKELAQVCVVDSDGTTYGSGGTDLIVTSVAPPYGTYFLFEKGYVPLASDITTEGATASIRAYAAAYNVNGDPCCAEMGDTRHRTIYVDAMYEENNRVPARAQMDGNGGVLVSLSDTYPAGTQIAIVLVYSGLYRSRLAPPNGGACDLPGDMCSYVTPQGGLTGWVSRFYVGGAPPTSASSSAGSKE